MAGKSVDEWLTTLNGFSPESLTAYIRAEDERIKKQLVQLADHIHAAMTAWHSLGTRDTVRETFRKLEDYLAGVSRRRTSWLKNLIFRLRDFVNESEPHAEFPKDLARQLDLVYQNTATYQLRMKSLAGEHAGVLGAYKAWIAALTHTGGASPNAVLTDIIRRSVEFISAQQQLAHAAGLQLENILTMAADIRHVAAIARSLSLNKDAVRQLQGQRYQREINFLREYFEKEE